MVQIENAWAMTQEGIAMVGSILSGGMRPALTADGIRAIEGALALAKTEPGYAAQNQAWFDALAQRNKDGLPAEREAMLVAAQRAESMRDRVIGRLNK